MEEQAVEEEFKARMEVRRKRKGDTQGDPDPENTEGGSRKSKQPRSELSQDTSGNSTTVDQTTSKRGKVPIRSKTKLVEVRSQKAVVSVKFKDEPGHDPRETFNLKSNYLTSNNKDRGSRVQIWGETTSEVKTQDYKGEPSGKPSHSESKIQITNSEVEESPEEETRSEVCGSEKPDSVD